MDISKKEKRAFWAHHVKAWQASGSSRSAYCRHHDLKLHQLIYWISTLDANVIVKPRASPVAASSGFIPVRVTPSPQSLTVRLPNGIRIEGVGAANLSVIREMMGWCS